MRDIKFRIWSKETQKMLYYEEQPVPCLTLNGVLCGENHTNVSYKYILMQYTGLKDLWQGDKVKYQHKTALTEWMAIVVWDEKRFRWGMMCEDETIVSIEILQGYNWEVIGNIHANPELEEGKE